MIQSINELCFPGVFSSKALRFYMCQSINELCFLGVFSSKALRFYMCQSINELCFPGVFSRFQAKHLSAQDKIPSRVLPRGKIETSCYSLMFNQNSTLKIL